jgi:hypothetical protein
MQPNGGHSACIRLKLNSIAFASRVPGRVGIDITSIDRCFGILNLAHGGTSTTDATAHVDAARSIHDVERKRSNESGPAEPQEGAGGLCLAAVLLGIGGRVAHAVGCGVCLEAVLATIYIQLHTTWCRKYNKTYPVRTAMRTQVRRQRNRRAKAEQHAQRIHGSVDNRDAELVQERRGDEVQQSEQPPQADE